MPINGYAVPFHVNTLKSVIKQEEGDYTVLRFMFVTPGAITGKKEDTPFEDPSATFIRGITYRSTDSFRYAELHKEITDLKKAAVKRDNERKELADVVEQDKLVEVRGTSPCSLLLTVLLSLRDKTDSRPPPPPLRTLCTAGKRPIRLTEVQLRPSFDGKRQSGDVEIHTNGIRYQSSVKSEQKIGAHSSSSIASVLRSKRVVLTRPPRHPPADILFSNIKHLLFQPCDNELIVVLHIHLKSPIMIGKKKAKDVQFFREVSDASFDETGNKKRKRNYHDEDELEAEQEERKRRMDLNKYFKAFSDKIAEAVRRRLVVGLDVLGAAHKLTLSLRAPSRTAASRSTSPSASSASRVSPSAPTCSSSRRPTRSSSSPSRPSLSSRSPRSRSLTSSASSTASRTLTSSLSSKTLRARPSTSTRSRATSSTTLRSGSSASRPPTRSSSSSGAD